MSDAAESQAKRLPCLDWLRFLVVLSLAPFHAALSYTGVGSVFVYDAPIRDAIIAGNLGWDRGPAAMRLFTTFMDNWFMHLLFLVSGIGAAFALRKRSPGEFIGERANRLLWPFTIGFFIIVPFQSWLRALSFGRFAGGFLAFYPSFFNAPNQGPASPGNFDWGHFWFLIYLFAFSALALPLFARVIAKGERSILQRLAARLSKGLLLLAPALWFALLEAAFRPGWPGFQNLVNDWANFTVYLSFFVLGFLAGRAPAFLEAADRLRWPALALGLGAFACREAVYSFLDAAPGYGRANMLAQAFRGIASYGFVVAALGFGRRYLNRESRALSVARDLSFPLYVLHFAPLSAATFLLIGSGLSVWARWSISVAASWACVAAFSAAARFVPGLRDFFGIRPPARRSKGSVL